ncbi:MAG: HPF/RaiA family ribosome-associated protein [Planctomycetaceae bacterium]|nr:HPF/RaiA family ribosome-associated protein [Planctomycetaceae bacterium]
MQVPLQVSFRNVDRSDAIEAAVREKAAKLEEFFDRITSCHVIIEAPHQHHQRGNLYRVSIHLAVPRKELVVDRQPPEHHAAEDVRVALREAFDSMRRQLEDYVREVRGDVKPHAEPDVARVYKLFPEADYGFLTTSDGREIYFHAHSVLDGFNRLQHGTEVRFVEEEGEKGPQATSIRIVG